MVEDLLRGFVNEAWVQHVDFTTLERVSGSYVSDDLRDREDDIIWRVRWGAGWLYLYLLLEFQSTVDPYMALRLLVYVGLLYQSLIRAKQLPASGKLPPVVPIVLYNGRRPWTAAKTMASLVEPAPAGLAWYCPQIRYLLLEERLYTEQELAGLQNLAAALFRFENGEEPADIQRVLEVLLEWLRAPGDDSLRRAFTVWLRRVLLPARLPKVSIPNVHNLTEVHAMLAERVIEWTQQWKEQGLQEGRREGRREGQIQEARAMILAAIRARFGRVPRDVTAALKRLTTPETLHALHRHAVTCPTLDAFQEALRTMV